MEVLRRIRDTLSGYADYRVRGFTYRLNPHGASPDVARKLHKLNSMAIEIISFVKRWLSAAYNGELTVEDAMVAPVPRIQLIYDRLSSRYDPDSVFESKASGEDTSFVVDQGEEIHMCVRVEGTFERDDVLLAVLTHELSHVASTTPDHDDEFWENYGIMQRLVARMGYVKLADIEADGSTHCGKVFIGRDEMSEIATGGPNARSTSSAARSRYKGRADLHRSPTTLIQDSSVGLSEQWYELGAGRQGEINRPRSSGGYEMVRELSFPSLTSPENAVEGYGWRYREIEGGYGGFGQELSGSSNEALSPFPGVHRYTPPGFATDRPILYGYKSIMPMPGDTGSSRGRLTKLSNLPNPISVEFYSRY